MSSPESVALIQRARKGDQAAWEEICKRYYPAWLRQLHGKLGDDLRDLCETVDLVQSALIYAFRKIEDLKNEGAFFAWVTAIGRRKICEQRRKVGRRRNIPLNAIGEFPEAKTSIENRLQKKEEGERVLDAILDLFPEHQSPMSAVYLKYYHKQPIASLAAIFGRSERTIARLLKQGLQLLEKELNLKGRQDEYSS